MSLQKFLSSRRGRRFYNFAYCWGACMVIAGALFKIMHLPFDNVLLLIGMAVEIIIFFISGFDIPSADYRWERVFPELAEDYEGETRHKVQDSSDASSSRKSATSGNIQVEELAEVSREAKEMSHLMRQLNDQYRQMLEAMNVKTK